MEIKSKSKTIHNMKRKLFILIAFLALSATCSQVRAQEVYKMVMESATRIVNNPTSNYTLTRVAQFKRTALTYMRGKALENPDSATVHFLDTQAYYLNEFTDRFFREILKLNGNARKDCIMTFVKASSENPIWNDPDKATTESFIGTGELTPFSLDTDWEKAYKKIEDTFGK